MSKRPAIPIDVVRAIMIESGHRCAVCGTPCPLEKAHIVPWRQSNDHSVENLICLCANCHERADNEPWDRKTFYEYKKRPWVDRQFGSTPPGKDQKRKQVQVTIDLSKANFDRTEQEWLRHGLASFLDIPPQQVQILSVKDGSVKVTVSLPLSSADKVLSSPLREIQTALAPVRVMAVKSVSHNATLAETADKQLDLWEALLEKILPWFIEDFPEDIQVNEPGEAIVWAFARMCESVRATDQPRGARDTPFGFWLTLFERPWRRSRGAHQPEAFEARRAQDASPFEDKISQLTNLTNVIRRLEGPIRSLVIDRCFRDLNSEESAAALKAGLIEAWESFIIQIVPMLAVRAMSRGLRPDQATPTIISLFRRIRHTIPEQPSSKSVRSVALQLLRDSIRELLSKPLRRDTRVAGQFDYHRRLPKAQMFRERVLQFVATLHDICQLPEDTRWVVVDCLCENLDQEKIAAKYSMSRRAFRALAFRGVCSATRVAALTDKTTVLRLINEGTFD